MTLVQFVVECACEQANAPLTFEPFPIWVEWPPSRYPDWQKRYCDAELVYRISPESADEARTSLGFPKTGNPRHVCEHMGHVIE